MVSAVARKRFFSGENVIFSVTRSVFGRWPRPRYRTVSIGFHRQALSLRELTYLGSLEKNSFLKKKARSLFHRNTVNTSSINIL